MDLQSLKYFQFVAMYRNFSKAAEHFYIGQPALSRQIASLEKELGVQLFDRDTRNVALTEAGSVLYGNVDLLLRHHEHVYTLMESAKKGHEGTLTIAAVRDFAPLFTDYVTHFIAKYPNVRTRVEDIPFDTLSDSIIHGVYDAAFTLDFAVPENDRLARVPVGKDQFVAICAKDADFALGPTATTAELLALPLIIPRHADPPFLKRLRLLGRDHRGAAAGIEYVPNTTTAMLQASMGQGIAFVPSRVLGPTGESEKFRSSRLSDLDTEFSLLLIRRKENAATTLQNFVGLVRGDRRVYRPAR